MIVVVLLVIYLPINNTSIVPPFMNYKEVDRKIYEYRGFVLILIMRTLIYLSFFFFYDART